MSKLAPPPLGGLNCKVQFVGDTAGDPHAHLVAEQQAAAVFRFQAVSRDKAIRGDLPQQMTFTTLPNGVRLRYLFNNGMEILQVYVPPVLLPTTSTTAAEPEDLANRILVIDIMFPCDPYVELNQVDAPHWLNLLSKARFNYLWASGVALQQATGDIDVTSSTPFGLSLGGTDVLACAEILPTKVIEATALAHPPDPIPDFTLVHDPAEWSIALHDSYNNYQGVSDIDHLYLKRVGTSYLLRPKNTAPVTLMIGFAHANMRDENTYIGHAPAYFKNTTYAPIVIQAREYNMTDQLIRLAAKTKAQEYTVTATATSGAEGIADTLDRSYTNTGEVDWHFFAKSGYEFVDGKNPIDPTLAGMGDLLYAGDKDSTQAFTLSADGSTVNLGGFDLEGYTAWNGTYDYQGVAGPSASEIYETMTYTGSAADMTQIATLTYHPNGAGKGTVTVAYL